jgi:hypothetical protein
MEVKLELSILRTVPLSTSRGLRGDSSRAAHYELTWLLPTVLTEDVSTAEVKGSHKRFEDDFFPSTGCNGSLLEAVRRCYNYRSYIDLKLVVCIMLRVLGQVQGFRLTQHWFEYFIQ